MTELSQQLVFPAGSASTAGHGPPIDVGHLGRITQGERSLEFQVLELFDRQCELMLIRMHEVAPEGIASLAHTLTGSAREIGAWRVAAAAEALERTAAGTREIGIALDTLNDAVIEARLAICALLRIASLTAAARN